MANYLRIDIRYHLAQATEHEITLLIVSQIDRLVSCFGFNGPLRQHSSLYRVVSQREGDRGEIGYMREKMSKQPPPAPTTSSVGPCPLII